jgi:hypothetical protein
MPKNKFFTPIDLPDPPKEKQTADPSVPNWPSPERFSVILDRIAVELNNIQTGISKLTPYGISFTTGIGQNTAPIMHSFNQFKTAPTKENMDSFLQMVQQDVNLLAKKEFKKWLNIITKEKEENEQ